MQGPRPPVDLDGEHATARIQELPDDALPRPLHRSAGRSAAARRAVSRRAVPQAVLAGAPDEVEAQFYEALRKGDIEALMALWADDDEIVCVHPGGQRMVGAAAIRASFESLFAHGGIAVHPEQLHRLQQPGSAFHHLVERIDLRSDGGTAWVLASNFYLKTGLGWRLAAHHASPGSPREPEPSHPEFAATLH